MGILIIATSAEYLGPDGANPTGVWLEELAAPYFMFKKAGYGVDVASPLGGAIPIDPASIIDQAPPPATRRFLSEPDHRKKIEDSLYTSDVVAVETFDAVYVPGGHGANVDLPNDPSTQQILAHAADTGKVIGSVCHGPAAFVNVKLKNGKNIVDGKNVTGFSNEEERQVGKEKLVPFLLEDKLKELGGIYTIASAPWQPYVVEDLQGHKLVTGRNPASSEGVGAAMLRALR